MVWPVLLNARKSIFITTKMSKGKSHAYFLLIFLGSATTKWVKFQRVCRGSKVLFLVLIFTWNVFKCWGN